MEKYIMYVVLKTTGEHGFVRDHIARSCILSDDMTLAKEYTGREWRMAIHDLQDDYVCTVLKKVWIS